MSGEALWWNINILKLTKVKAFIRAVQTFLVRWLVSAKKTPSPLSFHGWITAHCSLLPAEDEDDGAILLADLINRASRHSNRAGVTATKRWRYLTLICTRTRVKRQLPEDVIQSCNKWHDEKKRKKGACYLRWGCQLLIFLSCMEHSHAPV